MISRRLLRIKILQIIYAHFSSEESALSKSEKELLFSINKTYELYCYMLLLPGALRQYALDRMELALRKNLPEHKDLHPNMRFTENRVIALLDNNRALRKFADNHKLSWNRYPEFIRSLYQQLQESSYYDNYMTRAENDFSDDLNLIVRFFTEELEANELLANLLEEQSIYWNDDLEYVLGIIIQDVKTWLPEKDPGILPLFKNDDDKDFALNLLRLSVTNYKANRELTDQFVTNWDVDRIAFTDALILNMAITEISEFPSIPVKVSFDEYLELSKFYSTSRSSVFINGILDKMVQHLQSQDKIQKRGRGLMEGN